LLAAIFARLKVPNLLALMIAVLVAEVPVSWWVMVRRVRRETGGRFTLADAFPWRGRVPWWQFLVIGIPVLLFSLVMMGGVGPQVGEALRGAFFSWVPEWLVMRPDPRIFAGLSRTVTLAIWVLGLVSFTLIGGFTQELYSRGFLLPRMAHLGSWAPVLNALLFAVFHLASPWSWPAFFVIVLPWALLVWWKRSIQIGLFVHVGMLLLQWVGMSLMLFGLVPLPGG
jgi:hypothetical protein